MRVELQHGSGITPYFTTIINSTVQVCQFLNGTDRNPVLKWIIDAITETIPEGFIHPCPYFGRLQAFNVSLSGEGVPTQFVKGHYKTFFRFFDEKDENIITLKLGTEE